jgi:hypothetical protein
VLKETKVNKMRTEIEMGICVKRGRNKQNTLLSGLLEIEMGICVKRGRNKQNTLLSGLCVE